MKLTRIPINSTELVEIKNLDDLQSTEVNGAVVKISPNLYPNEIKALDKAGIENSLKIRGAISVIIKPNIIDNNIVTEEKIVADQNIDPVAMLIDRVKALSDGDIQKVALEIVKNTFKLIQP
jgi:hypothetical protein